MRSLTRHGHSLLELLVVLVLLGVAIAAVGQLGRSGARLVQGAELAWRRQRDAGLLAAVLQHAIPGAGHALGIRPLDTLDFDRRIGEGPACLAVGSTLWLDAGGAGWTRAPDPSRDQLDLLLGLEPVLWVRRQLLTSAADSCGGRPAFRVLLDSVVDSATWARVVSPVRMRAYGPSAARALGLEDRPGGGLQPFLGPFAGPIGFADSAGTLQVHLPWIGIPALGFPVAVAR
ncbi:MAG: prepilin-type N-terminal cleavage/methylation domain-containing protein [Gemmatimonadales bacterium]|nr:prepilin-type N-terminal cleavage/methylation domain-containing protein [Gemmatimonadales bacterium]